MLAAVEKMNASSQCDLTYKDSSDKKTQAAFKGKVKSTQTKPEVKHKCISTDETPLYSTVSVLPEGSATNFTHGPVIIGIIGALQQDSNYESDSPILVKRSASELLSAECRSKAFMSGYNVYESEALQQVEKILETISDLDYNYQHKCVGSFSCLTVSRSDMFQDIGGIYEVPVKIQFSSDGILSVLLAFKPALRETYFDCETSKIDTSVTYRALNYLNRNNVFCSGIQTEFKFAKVMSFDVIHHPCERRQSKHCPIIFRPPQSSLGKKENTLICPKCSSLEKYLKRREKKLESSPKSKMRRHHISSKFPIENLAPKSRHIRIKNIRNHRYRQNIRIIKIEKELKVASHLIPSNVSKCLKC